MRAFLGLLMVSSLVVGAAEKNSPGAKKREFPATDREAVEHFSITFGTPFKIKNILGTEKEVSLVEKDGNYYLHTTCQYYGNPKMRDFLVRAGVEVAGVREHAIYIFFTQNRGVKMAGAIYVINPHGEAVKVDDITKLDLEW